MKALLLFMCMLQAVRAFEPVTVVPPEGRFWVGQRIPLVIELRVEGQFAGSTVFHLPEVERTHLLQTGNPTVSSERREGKELFLQRHQISVFTQVEGELVIPEFKVEYGVRQGGETNRRSHTVPALALNTLRPDGAPEGRALVSTRSYSATQNWSGPSETAKVGDVITRVVHQQAGEVSGMALPPLPLEAPDGVRVYPPQVEVSDETHRGQLSGSRLETVRYRLEAPGTLQLPAVQLIWWNPDTEKFQRQTLAGKRLQVKGPLMSADNPKALLWVLWIALSVILFLLTMRIFWKQILKILPVPQHLPPLNPPTDPRSP